MEQVTKRQMADFQKVLRPIQARLIQRHGLKKFESWREARLKRIELKDDVTGEF